MARRIRAKEILRLKAVNGLSQNAIAATAHVSKHSVQDVLEAASGKGIVWEDIQDKGEDDIYALLFPEKEAPGPIYPDPDWEHIHNELARVGVTLKLLHAEYVDACSAKGGPAMSYDRFCKRYKDYTVAHSITSRVGHKAGRIMEVDWSGPTMQLVDPITGEVSKVYLFVACLPFSRYSYVEPTLDMKQNTWLMCHVHAFEFFGGAIPCIVPDNLKVGVKKHPHQGEVELNHAYEELSSYYGAAILPTRVRKPKDKPSAENEVWSAATYIIAQLRQQVFTDLGALKTAVLNQVAKHNATPFAKREGSRLEVFNEVEKPLLKPLPVKPFEICSWVYGRKIQSNCHVAYEHNYYSVSYLYVGASVDLRVTASTVEIFLGGQRIATHPRFASYIHNRYSTHEEDMPDAQTHTDWNAERIRTWAARIGSACTEVINRIFISCKFEEQGYNACLAILRLSHKYGSQRLECACKMTLTAGKRSPRYRDIEPLLKSGQDKLLNSSPLEDVGYIRGAFFYGED